MKSILTASICSAALAMAVPAMAQSSDSSSPAPKHKMHHHMTRMAKNHMQGPHTKSKPAGDPDTAQLNEQSLNAARGGTSPSIGSQPGAMAPASTAPGTGTTAPAGSGAMAPAGSGTPASAAPSNAPGGQSSAGGQ